MEIKIKLNEVSSNNVQQGNMGIEPIRKNSTDAGADLSTPIDFVVQPGECYFVDFGVSLEIPDGYVGLIYARSGLGSYYGVVPRNAVGVIDSKYRGSIGMMVENKHDGIMTFNRGERIAQIVISPIVTPSFKVVEELDSNEDRGGGFGSTGV